MNTEIEIKARAGDFAAMEKRILAAGGSFKREYDKRDAYYYLNVGGNGDIREVRLRLDGQSAIVTQKEKTMRHGIETNAEREFEVSHVENFLHLLTGSGYELYIEKHKQGRSFSLDGFLLELSEVEGLGCFLEIERVVAGRAPVEEVAGIEAEIFSLMERLKLSREDIEELPYTLMLARKAGKSHPRYPEKSAG